MDIDRIGIKDLPIILEENCLMTRYHGLIPKRESYVTRLLERGINDTLDFMKSFEAGEVVFDNVHDKLLYSLLKFHMFRDIKLKKIPMISEVLLNRLVDENIMTARELLMANQQLLSTSSISVVELRHLVGVVDMMRLPGVKMFVGICMLRRDIVHYLMLHLAM